MNLRRVPLLSVDEDWSARKCIFLRINFCHVCLTSHGFKFPGQELQKVWTKSVYSSHWCANVCHGTFETYTFVTSWLAWPNKRSAIMNILVRALKYRHMRNWNWAIDTKNINNWPEGSAVQSNISSLCKLFLDALAIWSGSHIYWCTEESKTKDQTKVSAF